MVYDKKLVVFFVMFAFFLGCENFEPNVELKNTIEKINQTMGNTLKRTYPPYTHRHTHTNDVQ